MNKKEVNWEYLIITIINGWFRGIVLIEIVLQKVYTNLAVERFNAVHYLYYLSFKQLKIKNKKSVDNETARWYYK